MTDHCPDFAVVTNFSEKGMCLSTGYCLPCDNPIELLIPLKAEALKVLVRVRRLSKVDDFNYILGVELIDAPDEYIKFVINHRNVFNSLKGFQFNERFRVYNYDL